MKRLSLLLALVIFVPAVASAQEDWTKSLFKGLGDSGAKKKAELDQIDFQFAISVNENASFFDVEQKGEGWARGLYSLKEKSERTASEVAADTLGVAIELYNLRLYKMAESSFIEAKNYMETNNLKEDISYLRCLSNIGLVYLVQGRMDEAQQYLTDAISMS
ncbi:MAG: tetratricopeptide repeat protein, partial [Cyclobacteriaceae bacterium]